MLVVVTGGVVPLKSQEFAGSKMLGGLWGGGSSRVGGEGLSCLPGKDVAGESAGKNQWHLGGNKQKLKSYAIENNK